MIGQGPNEMSPVSYALAGLHSAWKIRTDYPQVHLFGNSLHDHSSSTPSHQVSAARDAKFALVDLLHENVGDQLGISVSNL